VHHQPIGLVAVIVCALHSDHVLVVEEDENQHGEDTEGEADDYFPQHRDNDPPPGVGDATHVLVFEEVWEFAQHFPDEEGGIFLGQCELPVVADAGDVAEGEGEA